MRRLFENMEINKFESRGFIVPESAQYRLTRFSPEPRVVFDVQNHEHRTSIREYLKKKSWGKGCPFLLEDPFTNIHDMLITKLAHHTLENEMEAVE